jgi:tripartite-type tricarboxylate transporter receptor subunit TctC
MKQYLSARAAIVVVLGLIALVATLPVRAQSYPSRTVQLVVANPAGGAGDIMAKAISEPLAKALGQLVSVEYRAGASGALGARSVARAMPDGSTLLVGQTTEIVNWSPKNGRHEVC